MRTKETEISRVHFIKAQFVGPGRRQGAHINLVSQRGMGRVRIPVNLAEPARLEEIAPQWLTENGYTVRCEGSVPGGMIYGIEEFDSLVGRKEAI